MANYLKMTAKKLTEELVKRGFDEADLKGLSKEELVQQLLDDDSSPAVSSEEITEAVDESESDDDVDSVDIIKGDEYIRTYSKTSHGKEYKKLAEEFAGKKTGYEIVKPGLVKRIEVRYREYDAEKKAYLTKAEAFTDKAQALAHKASKAKAVCVFR